MAHLYVTLTVRETVRYELTDEDAAKMLAEPSLVTALEDERFSHVMDSGESESVNVHEETIEEAHVAQ